MEIGPILPRNIETMTIPLPRLSRDGVRPLDRPTVPSALTISYSASVWEMPPRDIRRTVMTNTAARLKNTMAEAFRICSSETRR